MSELLDNFNPELLMIPIAEQGSTVERQTELPTPTDGLDFDFSDMDLADFPDFDATTHTHHIKMPTRINVNAKPFRSSRLAVPPSPFSPLSPLTPPALKRTYSATPDVDLIEHLPPPTQQPMRWLWSCHICHRQYNLSVTRRCLDDGHYFCAGTSMVRSRKDGKKRLQRHRACGSEFDYAGWKDWGCWRRNLLALTEQQRQMKSPCSSASVFEGDDESEDDMVDEIAPVAPPIAPGFPRSSSWRVSKPVIPQRPIKDCWNRCDYPSECRWGKQFGVDTPVQATFPTLSKVSSTPNPQKATEFVDVDMSDAPKTDFKDILTAEQQQVVAETIDGVECEDITAASTTVTPALAHLANLVSRAQRRHSRSETPVSPLASNGRPAVARSSSRKTLKRAVEGSIGAIAGLMGR